MTTTTGGPRRLLLAVPGLDRGGPDRVMFELARSLDRNEFDVHLAVVAPSGYYLSELPDDVEVHHLGESGRRTFDRYPGVRFARLTRALAPDVVMTTLRMIPTAELASHLHRDYTLVARVAGHVTAHREDVSNTTSTRARVFHDLMARGIERSDHVIAQSTAMAADLVSGGVEARRVRTIPNPIDGAWVDARTAEAPPAELRGAPRLLGVGRLEMQKGFDLLIRALPVLLDRHPDIHVTLLGEGSEHGPLTVLAAETGVSDAISFVGNVDNPFLYYASADLLVAPSRWEGLSNTTLEALATGLPVVATGGAAAGQDLVTSDHLGRVVDPGDPNAFAAAVLDALDGQFDRPRIAAETRDRFASKTIVAAYATVLNEDPPWRATGTFDVRRRVGHAKETARGLLGGAGIEVSPGPRSPEVTWRAPATRATTSLIEWVDADGALSGAGRLRVLDVGARWGLEPGMDALLGLSDRWIVGVDPDPDAAAGLRSSGQFDEVLEVALADAVGTHPLYLTRHPGCSSLRRPLPVTTMGDLRCADWFEVVDEIQVEVTTLDVAAAGTTFDLVKLDAQGADLDVLRGGEAALAGALGLFVEVQFEAFYEDQALFGEVQDWAAERGFLLVSLSDSFQRKEGFLGEANATYLARPSRLATRRDILAALVIAAALDEWGYVDLVLRTCESTIPSSDIASIRAATHQRTRRPRPIETPTG